MPLDGRCLVKDNKNDRAFFIYEGSIDRAKKPANHQSPIPCGILQFLSLYYMISSLTILKLFNKWWQSI